MSIDIKLERGVRGYNIIRKKCPNCDAEFVFKIHKGAVHDVAGEGLYYPEENVVRCKVCMSTFKYESKNKSQRPNKQHSLFSSSGKKKATTQQQLLPTLASVRFIVLNLIAAYTGYRSWSFITIH